MKRMTLLLVAVSLVVIGSGASAQDCKNGVCNLPAEVVQTAEVVVKAPVAVAKAPINFTKQIRTKKPLRTFFRRLFR
jgi:hypothetical protein